MRGVTTTGAAAGGAPGRNKNAKTIGMAAVAGVLLIVLIVRNLPSSADAAAADPADPGAAPSAAPAAAGPAAPKARVRIDWPTAMARDPFSSRVVFPPAPVAAPTTAVAAPVAPPKPDQQAVAAQARAVLHVTAILQGSKPYAVVNGLTCRPGNSVEGFVLRRVVNGRAVFERDGFEVAVKAE